MLHHSILSFAVALNAVAFGSAQTSIDIGSVSIAGSSTQQSTPGSWNVTGSGNDIWGSSDQFHFLHFPKNNDVTLTLFVNSLDSDNSWSKAGLMIRDTLAANSAHGSIFVTGAKYVAMQARLVTGGSSSSYHTSYGTHNVWLRLTKEGNKVTSYVRRESELQYTKHAQYVVNFSSDSFYVGIPLTSHNNGYLAKFIARDFEISEGAWGLPTRDIGDVGREVVSQEITAGAWSLKGAGTGIGGTADSFAFMNYKKTGDITAAVHLDRLEERNLNSKGGLMIRASNTVDSPHVSLLTTRKNGITMFYRTSIGGDTLSKNVGVWDSDVELKLVKTGNSIACLYKHSSAPEWFNLGSATIDLQPEFYVGLAVTSADYGNHATLYANSLEMIAA